MLLRRASLLLAALAGLASAVPARADEVAEAVVASTEAADATVAAGESVSLREYAGGCGACRTYREHAPLAIFSLGSLAVGGVFYGIQAAQEDGGSGPMSGNGARMEVAVGAAGLTALAAGAAYLYYALRGEDDPEARHTAASELSPAGADGPIAGSQRGFSAGADPAGGVAASYTFPLSLPLSALLE